MLKLELKCSRIKINKNILRESKNNDQIKRKILKKIRKL